MSVGIWNATTQEVEKVAGNVNINDSAVSDKSTWSSEKINVNLGEKQDYKIVVEDSRYVEDVVLQEMNNWLPNDNSSILVNLKKKNGAKYSSFQLICNKTDSQNWECIVNGAGILWKINYVNGVRTIQELATMDKVNETKIVKIEAGSLTIPASIQRSIKIQVPQYDGYMIIGALPITSGVGGVMYGGISINTDNTVDLWYYNVKSEEVNATITAGIIYQKQ